MRLTHTLPLLAFIASTPAAAADVEQLLQAMQERLTRLETRNTELERRLAEGVGARLDEVENAVLVMHKKPDPLEKFDGISVGASLLTVAQHAKRGATVSKELTARADIEVELPGGSIGAAEGKIFAHFRSGDGDGVGNEAFATSNATAFGTNPTPVLMQAWYQLDIPVGAAGGNLGQVELTAGKIDPFGFFDGNNIADDESEGFMNGAFVHNPLLDVGGDIGVGPHGASPGVRLAYVSDINGGNHVTASLGLFGAGAAAGANYSNSFSKPLTIAQIEYAGKTWKGLEGAYRVYGWNNQRATDQINTGEEKHAGWGISLDQQVTANTTLFARYGNSTKGNLNFDRAWTLGTQVSGAGWGRGNDRLGLAYGNLKASSEYVAAGTGSSDEKIYEVFYAWHANDSLQLTPSYQRIANPSGTGGDDVSVWGLRAKLAY